MAWGARSGLKLSDEATLTQPIKRLNGLGSPFGIETIPLHAEYLSHAEAKWPGEPVRD